jgi:hypothetical protein
MEGERDHKNAGKLEHRGRDTKEEPDGLAEEGIQKGELNGKE